MGGYIRPRLQRYAWGDTATLPTLLGLATDGAPVAEAWFGAHCRGPAVLEPRSIRTATTASASTDAVHAAEAGGQPLDAWLAEHGAAATGARVQQRFGGLPYLLKLLAAARPLSIQVHPTAEQAAEGYSREERAGIAADAAERCYRDPNHKPEVFLALTPFDALCGFRAPAEIAAALQATPEVRQLLPPFDAAEGEAAVRALLQAWFALRQQRIAPALDALLTRLAAEHAAQPFAATQPAYWALRAHRELGTPADRAAAGPDRGLLFIFLLQHVQLAPGEAMFLPAGVPHAYLAGTGVELMANSDNVLRAGLTTKHVDPAELLRIVRYDEIPSPRIEAVVAGDGVEESFVTPTEEFRLSRLLLPAGKRAARVACGPETLLVLPRPGVALPGADAVDGAARPAIVTLRDGSGEMGLAVGQACFVPDGTAYELACDVEDVMVARAHVPLSGPAPTAPIARDDAAAPPAAAASAAL